MTLTPGLYRATVRGVHDQVVMVDDAGYGATTVPIAGNLYHLLKFITDARPRYVLDLEEPGLAVTYLRGTFNTRLIDIADQIEAQTKPARIPEPGLWGVVEATYFGWHRCLWVLGEDGWFSHASEEYKRVIWTSLVDPVLVREGIN